MVSFSEVNAALDANFKVKLLKQGVSEKVVDVSLKLRQSSRIAEKEEKEIEKKQGGEEFLTPTRPAKNVQVTAFFN